MCLSKDLPPLLPGLSHLLLPSSRSRSHRGTWVAFWVRLLKELRELIEILGKLATYLTLAPLLVPAYVTSTLFRFANDKTSLSFLKQYSIGPVLFITRAVLKSAALLCRDLEKSFFLFQFVCLILCQIPKQKRSSIKTEKFHVVL